MAWQEINDRTIESGDFTELLALSEGGSYWLLKAIDIEPEATLAQWSVRETADGRRHFCGRTVEGAASESRISSPVQVFDPVRLRGRTVSGRIYQLHGEPGSHPGIDYLWQRWLRINTVGGWRDVTAEVLQRIAEGRGAAG